MWQSFGGGGISRYRHGSEIINTFHWVDQGKANGKPLEIPSLFF